VKSPTAIGVLGYSFLEQNGDRVKGAQLAGVPATFENIASGDYGLSRIMYFYVKDQNLTLVPGLIDYIEAFTSDSAFGPDGYLVEKGLIPLTDEDRDAQRAVAESLKAAASN
jgi:phosphate transport system substrate-binding protein